MKTSFAKTDKRQSFWIQWYNRLSNTQLNSSNILSIFSGKHIKQQLHLLIGFQVIAICPAVNQFYH